MTVSTTVALPVPSSKIQLWSSVAVRPVVPAGSTCVPSTVYTPVVPAMQYPPGPVSPVLEDIVSTELAELPAGTCRGEGEADNEKYVPANACLTSITGIVSRMRLRLRRKTDER